jgi:hypothetical protein
MDQMKIKHKVFLETPKLKAYMRGLSPLHYEDFYQDFYFIIDNMPDDLAEDLHTRGKLIGYYCRIIFNELTNKSSKFARKYKGEEYFSSAEFIEQEVEVYDMEADAKFQASMERVRIAIDQPKTLSDWYVGKVVEKVVEHGSLRKASEALGIKATTLHFAVNKFRKRLNEK